MKILPRRNAFNYSIFGCIYSHNCSDLWLMIGLNATFALYSSLFNKGDLYCISADIDVFFPVTATSPIQMFRCLVLQDANMPAYCNSQFYNSLRSGCVSCTFSTLTVAYLGCFEHCSTDASAEYCQQCSQSYLASWQSQCASGLTIPAITSTLDPTGSSCSENTFTALGGVSTMASELTSCLAVNQTISSTCMASRGYVDLPTTCSSCLFATKAITDSVCTSVCSKRPFSGMCRKCISSFVSTTIMRCFKYANFPIPIQASCDDSDMKFIGTDPSAFPAFVRACDGTPECASGTAGLKFAPDKTISNSCMHCLSVSVGKKDKCRGDSCEKVVSDCIATPVTQAITEQGSCLFSDLSILGSGSASLAAMNACIYQSNNTERISTCIAEAGFSSPCLSCVINSLPTFNKCGAHPACVADVKSTDCQTCVTQAYNTAFLSCYATGVTKSCSVNEVANLSENVWGTALFQRCVRDSPLQSTSCFEEASLFTESSQPGTGCQNCLSSKLTSQTTCLTACMSEPGSTDCATCTTRMMSDITKGCTENPNLTLNSGSAITTKDHDTIFDNKPTVLAILLIQLVVFNM
jgi:hypothetical protein